MQREGDNLTWQRSSLLTLVVAVLAALVACAPGPAPVQSPTPQGPVRRVRLVTWNLHDFFDAVDDPYEDEVPSPLEVERKLEALAAVLRQVDADLVAVQEVENGALLERLASRTGHGQVVLQEGNDVQRGIDVGLMSRIPLRGFASHAADRLPRTAGVPANYRYSRDCLEVHVAVPGGLVILVNHFKSQASGGAASESKRLAQARGVRRLVEKLGPIPVAVVGDLNADPDSGSLEPLLRGPLTDVLGGLSFRERVTFEKGPWSSALDYILLNPTLASRMVPGSARVHDAPPSRVASDHRPVLVDLDLPSSIGAEGSPSWAGEAGVR